MNHFTTLCLAEHYNRELCLNRHWKKHTTVLLNNSTVLCSYVGQSLVFNWMHDQGKKNKTDKTSNDLGIVVSGHKQALKGSALDLLNGSSCPYWLPKYPFLNVFQYKNREQTHSKLCHLKNNYFPTVISSGFGRLRQIMPPADIVVRAGKSCMYYSAEQLEILFHV